MKQDNLGVDPVPCAHVALRARLSPESAGRLLPTGTPYDPSSPTTWYQIPCRVLRMATNGSKRAIVPSKALEDLTRMVSDVSPHISEMDRVIAASSTSSASPDAASTASTCGRIFLWHVGFIQL